MPFLRIKYERHKQGYTQAELGAACGLKQAVIAQVESGRVNPTSDELAALSRALQVYPPHVLLKPVLVQDPEETSAPVESVAS